MQTSTQRVSVDVLVLLASAIITVMPFFQNPEDRPPFHQIFEDLQAFHEDRQHIDGVWDNSDKTTEVQIIHAKQELNA